MANRTKRLFYIFGASCMFGVSCLYGQQSKFQTPFTSAVPGTLAVAEIGAPLLTPPDLYLHELPALIQRVMPPSGRMHSRAVLLTEQAEQAYRRGKQFYQAKDVTQARKEFDSAIDLMLEASEDNPPDRQGFDTKVDKMVDSIHRYDLAGMGAAVDVEEAQFDKAPLEDILQMTFPVDPKLKDKVKEQVQATASQLPLSVNDAVLGYIHYFSGRGRKTVIAGLQREGRYHPLIQRILEEEGVPRELVHLAQAESGFFPRAMSSKAAAGMWQFVAWRGQEYGLKQTRYTDDRLDPEKATRASAKHLHDLYNEFGDWYLAIAAYNCGPNVVERAVARTGYADFWELRNRGVLPAETTNYVPIILAMTIMAKNAPEYGLDSVTPDAPLEYDTIEVTSPTHLALVADSTGTPLPELVELNPALLRAVAPGGYMLHVPKGTGEALEASLQLIPAERRASWRMHKVASGETLASIGKRFGMPASSIAAVNGLTSASPVEGDRLVIPAAYRDDSAPVHVSARHHAVKRVVRKRRSLTPVTRTASNRVPRPAGAD